MTLKETIISSLISYPLIMKNALNVYDHLFCTIGNGYEWVNGELMCEDDKKVNIKEGVINLLDNKLFKNKDIMDKYYQHGIIDKYYENILDEIKLIFDVSKRSEDFSIPIGNNCFTGFYPLCSYSKMCCFPDNIKDDWFEGIKKMVEIMENNPSYLTGNENDKWLQIVKNKIIEHEERRKNV